jgi:hypothetical protein
LPTIKTPVLILNASNDSFLSPSCYPHELASQSKNIFLETSRYGGHVGFHISNTIYYSKNVLWNFSYKNSRFINLILADKKVNCPNFTTFAKLKSLYDSIHDGLW